jgi:hypothetical protein
MTNPIGASTANITYNAPWEEARILGAEACGEDKSRGELLRELILAGAKVLKPHLAAKIEFVRKHSREFGSAVQLVIFLAWLGGGDGEAIRAPRSVRGRKNEWEAVAC